VSLGKNYRYKRVHFILIFGPKIFIILSNIFDNQAREMLFPMILIVLFGICIPFFFITFIYFGLTKEDVATNHPKLASFQNAMKASTSSSNQQQDNTIDKAFTKQQATSSDLLSLKKDNQIPAKQPMDIYKRIHELFDIGIKDPKSLYSILLTQDIFGVHNIPFSKTSTFTSCPSHQQSLVDYNDITNHDFLDMFRNGTKGAFVFFQHLRKAGGTGFCDLATRNMGQAAIPPYYCMPDNVSPTYLSIHSFIHSLSFIICHSSIERIISYSTVG